MVTAREITGREYTGGRNPSGRQRWIVTDSPDSYSAEVVVKAVSLALWRGLWRQQIRIEEVGGNVWRAEVPYGTQPNPDNPDNVTYSFDIGTTELHISHSLETQGRYAVVGDAPSHRGAIGVKKDANGLTIEGVNIKVPYFTWQETHSWPAALVNTAAYFLTLENAAGKINSQPWRIWAKGELLFLGVTGGKQAEKDVSLTYKFASSRTRNNFVVGDIPVATKEGHSYLWIEYESVDDDPYMTLVSNPKGVYVERVYEYTDLTALGLNAPWS